MTTHVLIVDEKTLKLHLEYLFIGTGAKEYAVDFNNCTQSSLFHSVEKMLVAMIADGSRIRIADKIIFYLRAKQGYEGKFFGVFGVVDNGIFLDNNDSEQFLKSELGKSLTFRSFITPLDVYAEGVTEWEALDEIKNIYSPNQMLWSLIYRKLKGHRGNTMITMYESERLIQLIRNKNQRRDLNRSGQCFSYDADSQRIIAIDENYSYTGRQERINLLPRLIEKHDQGKAFEAHLQGYIAQNIGFGNNHSLDDTILGESKIEWLGNEVSCGVGMQRMDLLLSMRIAERTTLVPIELKAVEASADNIRQIQRYVDWLQQYYIPNQPSDIHPVLLTKKITDKNHNSYRDMVEKIHLFNDTNSGSCETLKFIEFSVEQNDLLFESVDYSRTGS